MTLLIFLLSDHQLITCWCSSRSYPRFSPLLFSYHVLFPVFCFLFFWMAFLFPWTPVTTHTDEFPSISLDGTALSSSLCHVSPSLLGMCSMCFCSSVYGSFHCSPKPAPLVSLPIPQTINLEFHQLVQERSITYTLSIHPHPETEKSISSFLYISPPLEILIATLSLLV